MRNVDDILWEGAADERRDLNREDHAPRQAGRRAHGGWPRARGRGERPRRSGERVLTWAWVWHWLWRLQLYAVDFEGGRVFCRRNLEVLFRVYMIN